MAYIGVYAVLAFYAHVCQFEKIFWWPQAMAEILLHCETYPLVDVGKFKNTYCWQVTAWQSGNETKLFHQQLIFLQDKITLRFCSTRQPREHLSHCRDVPPDKLSKKTWFSKEGRREGVWGQVKRCSTTKFWKSFGNLYKSSREMGSNGEVL